ncbi:hypothetical protein FACS189473_0220 [Spirochaetia bacterium]|nr:hypothetical protein FACS189473_0220 [Spirochaetia bacterium]
MGEDVIHLDMFAAGTGFNAALKHIKKTLSIIEGLEGQRKTGNLGDTLFELGDAELTGERLALLLRMVLVDKLGYTAISANLAGAVSDPAALAAEFARWKAVDMLAVYHHPGRGVTAANPKNACELALFGNLRKRELLVMYAGKGNAGADGQCEKAARLALALFEGEKPKIPADMYAGAFTVRKVKQPGTEIAARKTGKAAESKDLKSSRRRTAEAAQDAKARAGKRAAGAKKTAKAAEGEAAAPFPTGLVRMTPMYSVVVQNELFHNGNVEAWKRIIESYKAKYPGLQVSIYYEGERILDINSLFSWGKVKHGSAIQFTVAGREIRDVARLQRYLVQGASRHFEGFLRGAAGTVLRLF